MSALYPRAPAYFFAAPVIVSPAFCRSCPAPATVLQAASDRPKTPASSAIAIRFIVTSLSDAPHVDEMTGDGRGSRHRRTDQVRASAGALPALEVAVRGRRTALARLEPVGIHCQAHRAARFAPFEAGVAEDPVEPLGLGLLLHQPRPGNDHHQLDVRRLVLAAHDRGRLAQVLDARIRARADEDLVD